jgi:hypothetical protein
MSHRLLNEISLVIFPGFPKITALTGCCVSKCVRMGVTGAIYRTLPLVVFNWSLAQIGRVPVQQILGPKKPTRSQGQPTRCSLRLASASARKHETIAAEWFHSSEELLIYIDENAQSPEALGIPRIIATPIAK